jgi:hypothetical protein
VNEAIPRGMEHYNDHDDQLHIGHNTGYPHNTHSGNTYYIIPAGMNVIFQDEDGNEISRLANSAGRIIFNYLFYRTVLATLVIVGGLTAGLVDHAQSSFKMSSVAKSIGKYVKPRPLLDGDHTHQHWG